MAVVAAYGLILPKAILDAPKFGCLNVHASLLPRWRGAAPVQRAILAGDAETGVTIMQMDVGLDTGDMRAIQSTPIGGKTGGALTAELAEMGADLLVDVLASLKDHPAIPQPEAGVTYAAKIDKAESRIDFTRPAVEIERQVRAFAPAPGAFFEYQGERFRILAAECLESSGRAGDVIDAQLTIACGVGALRPILIQRAGKSAMPPAELLRGFSLPVGTQLS
jgi:methionyl-tRNA formyltransferase